MAPIPRAAFASSTSTPRFYREIGPQVVRIAPEAVQMVVTDPPNPLADLTRGLARHGIGAVFARLAEARCSGDLNPRHFTDELPNLLPHLFGLPEKEMAPALGLEQARAGYRGGQPKEQEQQSVRLRIAATEILHKLP